MKKRYIYSLLFGVPGLLVSLIISVIAFGAFAGILWLYVLGDDPWPTSTETMLPILFIFVFFALWFSFVFIGFITGKNLEECSELNTKHILASVCVTTVAVLLIFLYQVNAGNLGPISDTVLCAEICRGQGYSASGMPPKDSGERSCICFDRYGQEIMRIPIDVVSPDK
jgi:hypothetical protein